MQRHSETDGTEPHRKGIRFHAGKLRRVDDPLHQTLRAGSERRNGSERNDGVDHGERTDGRHGGQEEHRLIVPRSRDLAITFPGVAVLNRKAAPLPPQQLERYVGNLYRT